MWQPLAILFHIMNLNLLWIRRTCLNISAIGGDILSLSLDLWMIFPNMRVSNLQSLGDCFGKDVLGIFLGGNIISVTRCIKEIQMCHFLSNHSQTSHQHFNTQPPGPAGRPLGQWSFLQIFCAVAQRSKLVFANRLPITLGMDEATSPNTTRVTLATTTRCTGIQMAIYCPQGRDFHTRKQRKMVTKIMATKWSPWSHQLVLGWCQTQPGSYYWSLNNTAIQWWGLTLKEKRVKY